MILTHLICLGFLGTAGSSSIGGMAKRRGKRFEITINDQKFVAPSVPALEAIVLAWRKAHPANDTAPKPKPKPIPAPAKRIPETVVLADAGAQTPSGPEWREDRGTILPTMPLAISDAVARSEAARIAREKEEAIRKAVEEEEDDMEALMAILRVAA